MSVSKRLPRSIRFISSERFSDLLTRIDTHAEDLLDLQVKEKKSHETTWKRQGELVRAVQKVRAELCHEIDTIIGTAAAYGDEPMNTVPAVRKRDNVATLQERRLDRTVLRTYRTKADIDDIVPNEKQPRLGPKVDEELQRQIEANGGLFEPLLVEPHPNFPGSSESSTGTAAGPILGCSSIKGKQEFRNLPIEVTDRTLTEEDRLRVWIYIHRQRKEWDAKEKEMVAYRLVDLMGRASAANILGLTVRELDKMVDIFELSEKFTGLRDPSAAITWAPRTHGSQQEATHAKRCRSGREKGQ